MKIIEAMKEQKRLAEKVEDLQKKVANHCADLDYETPVYQNQGDIVQGWLQSIHDTIKEAMRLAIAVQKTNLATKVTIDIGEKEPVTHSIAEWILRRRTYANVEMASWSKLTDKNLREGQTTNSAGEKVVVKIRRYYDPLVRDKKIEVYRSEPGIIDRTLEVVNATTDIVE